MTTMPHIQILGAGCPTCKKLFELTQRAVKELNLAVEVEYVTDMQKLLDLGVMQSPALAVNGTPVMVGFVPDVSRIKDAITAALEQCP
jgi:small redox-active disulfide protein 2